MEGARLVLRPKDIPDFLLSSSPEHTVLLLGPPGIGKSVQVYGAARREAELLGREFVDFHRGLPGDWEERAGELYVYVDLRLTECVPEDLLGYPRPVDAKYYVYTPPLWAKVLSRPEIAGLLFLDEITNVQRDDVVAAAYKITLDRKVGFVKLSDRVRVIAAGNSPEHSAIARELPAPAVSRCKVVKIATPSVEEWAEYMEETYGDSWDRRVLAFLLRFRELFCPPVREASTLRQYPCPRNWTRLARELAKMPDEFLEVEAIADVGEEAGAAFATFARNPVPSLEELLEDPGKIHELSLDSKYLVAIMVGQAVAGMDNPERLRELVEEISKYPEFAAALALSIPKKMRYAAISRLGGRFREVVLKVGEALLS